VSRVLALDTGEEHFLDPLGDWATFAIANRAAINVADRGNLRACATQERLIRDIQLGTIDLAFFERNAEIARELGNAAASDALQDVAVHRRGDQRAIAHNEQVCAASF